MSADQIKTGTIKKKFEKGYGFIIEEGSEKDTFFHARELVDIDFKDLEIGMSVNYIIGKGRKGPEAVSVVVIPNKI